MSEQLSLFNIRPAFRVEQPKHLMGKDVLLKWKSKIFNHQQQALQTKAPYAKRYAKALKD